MSNDNDKSLLLEKLIVTTAALGVLFMAIRGDKDLSNNENKVVEEVEVSSNNDQKSDASSLLKVKSGRQYHKNIVEIYTPDNLRVLTTAKNVSVVGDFDSFNGKFDYNFDKVLFISNSGNVKVLDVYDWYLTDADGNVDVYTDTDCIKSNFANAILIDTSKAEKGAFERLVVSLLDDPVKEWEEKQKESYVSNDKVKVLSMNKKHM